ncbi:hypothetical protein LIA77_02625 [Sarocladium implicatum]|nr:hypothetical protein LIA77_02625 [Sarocladium implicatum]
MCFSRSLGSRPNPVIWGIGPDNRIRMASHHGEGCLLARRTVVHCTREILCYLTRTSDAKRGNPIQLAETAITERHVLRSVSCLCSGVAERSESHVDPIFVGLRSFWSTSYGYPSLEGTVGSLGHMCTNAAQTLLMSGGPEPP